MVNGNLPDGWTKTTLSEVGQLLRGVSYKKEDTSEKPKSGFVPILRATNIQDEKLILDSDLVYVPSKYVKPDQYLKPDDIVVCMSSGSKHLVGKTAQLSQNWKGSFGTFCAAIRPGNVLNGKFVGYFFSSPDYRDFIRQKSAGININNLKPTDFETLEIPVPPLPEQERIVAKIEELFTQLEAGMSALERVQAGLKRYKASVLRAAVEGKLGIQNDEFGMQDEGQLPAGWKEVEFKEIITSLKNGYFYGRPSSEPVGVPILRISAVRPMSVNYSDLRYVPEIKEEEVKNYFLEKGDLLFTRYNGNLSLVGACGVVRDGHQRTIYPDKLIRVRVKNELALPEYLEIYFSTIIARKLIESRVKSTAGQHGISGGDIKSLSVILPPLEEQRQIVAEVERRLSLAAGVESTLAASLSRAGRLRQSILKSAFEGRLV